MTKKSAPRRVMSRLAPIIHDRFAGEEHRQFPRAKLEVPFQLSIGEGGQKRFGATLRSVNVSVSGAFLESSFFLPMGTEVSVSFALDSGGEKVEARAQVIRQEPDADEADEGRSGMGIRFIEFMGQTEVTLARLFLSEQLFAFAEDYLASKRAKGLRNELERVVDALAAWELRKVTQPEDSWYRDDEKKPKR
ncbi:MAG: PilZ domain-containing protein [Myxococcaceae bacterium]